jgi:hypothetical protein
MLSVWHHFTLQLSQDMFAVQKVTSETVIFHAFYSGFSREKSLD